MLASFRRLIGRFPWQRRMTRAFWGNATESVFSIVLIGVGLVVLTWCIVSQFLAGQDFTLVEFSRRLIGIALSIVIMGIGVFRLLRVLYENAGSIEHRSQILQQALDLDYINPFETVQQEHPTVPNCEPGQIRRGSRFRYRLSNLEYSRARLLGLAAFSLVMLGVCTVLVALIREQWETLGLERFLVTVSVLLVLFFVTCGLLWRTGKRLVDQIQLGPTILELSEHPLLPAATYQVFFKQIGEIRLEKLAIVLECFEQATYQQGTDFCSEQHIAFQQTIGQFEEIELSREGVQHYVEFKVPADVMHSFSGTNNRIGWRMVVRGVKKGCREFRREYPVVMLPASANLPSPVF